jgi:hypothetical protein
MDNNKLIIYTMGGLGNILFQYFYAKSLSLEHNFSLYFIKNLHYWRGDINIYPIFNHLNYIEEKTVTPNNYTKLNEKNFYYDPFDLTLNNNYIISGYFQSYKYFNKYIKSIKESLFNNIKEEYEQTKTYYNNLTTNKKCLIHVRRGDYLNYPTIHPVCSDDYYIKAIENIINLNSNVTFILFSDDINFLNNWELIKKYNYIIITETDPVKTLILMSFSDYFIIANSTLSLASYFLRDTTESVIVAPSIWFGPNGFYYKIEDIVPPETIII